jgi:putative SOS response-associated peptidase YedK
MCGRFTLFEPDKILAREFGVSGIPLLSPRYNIAPSQPVAAVRAAPAGTGGRELALLRWGLIPSWSKDPAIGNRLINARAETVREKPSFRNAFKRHRCLIPASGFYEWQRRELRKQPFYIRMHDGRPFAFAGLWDRWENPDKGVIESCTILTTATNTLLAPIHDRMPVILPSGKYDQWLDPSLQDPDSLASLLVPFPPEDMIAFPVSPRVNTPSTDDEGCIAPLP